jgi:hypothetical protein
MLTGSLWLGKYPGTIDRVWSYVNSERGGPPVIWRDMFWMFVALSHPERASAWFENEHYFAPDDGNSLAYTYHFIENLKQLGHVDPSLTANTPLFAAFQRSGQRTYVAYNAEETPATITFSDGARLEAKPHALATLAR